MATGAYQAQVVGQIVLSVTIQVVKLQRNRLFQLVGKHANAAPSHQNVLGDQPLSQVVRLEGGSADEDLIDRPLARADCDALSGAPDP